MLGPQGSQRRRMKRRTEDLLIVGEWRGPSKPKINRTRQALLSLPIMPNASVSSLLAVVHVASHAALTEAAPGASGMLISPFQCSADLEFRPGALGIDVSR